MSISSPMPVAAPPPANTGPPKGRSAPPDGDPFASVLDQQARTATAEGLDKQETADQTAAARQGTPGDGAQPAGEEPARPGTDRPDLDPAALTAALNALLNGAAPAQAQAAAAGTPQTAAGGEQATAQVQTATPVSAPVAAPVVTNETPAAETAPAAAAVVAAATPAPDAQAAVAPAPADTSQDAPAAQPDADAAPAQADAQRTGSAATGTGTGDQPAAGDGRGRNGAQQQPVAASAATTGAAATEAPAPAAAPAAAASARAAAPAAAQPAAATAPASAPVAPGAAPAHHVGDAFAPVAEAAATHGRGVPIDRAVETVRLAMRAGAERGVTHARISLTPVELGSIEIHLRHTADGLLARVVADSTGAAQLLQQSAGDLRRQLEQQGVPLLRLDIGASGEQAGQAGAQRDFGALATGARGGDLRSSLDGEGDAVLAVGAETRPVGALHLSNGALVDVLA